MKSGASIYSAGPPTLKGQPCRIKNEALYGLQAATAKTSILETLSCMCECLLHILNVLPL